MTDFFLIVTFCLCMSACTGTESSPDQKAVSNTIQTSEISLAAYHAGKEIYMTHCFFCHGPEADGNGSLAASMEGPMPRDFTTPEMAAAHPDSLKRAILEGGEAVGLSSNMPGWSSTLTATDAELLVAFIQTVSKKGGLLPEPKNALKLTDIPQESQPTY